VTAVYWNKYHCLQPYVANIVMTVLLYMFIHAVTHTTLLLPPQFGVTAGAEEKLILPVMRGDGLTGGMGLNGDGDFMVFW